MSEKPKIPDRVKTNPDTSREAKPLTPEQQKLLSIFLQEKQKALATTNRRLNPETTTKPDYYGMAAVFGMRENTQSSTEESVNVLDDYITQDGILKNISGKTTINTIVKTPGVPKIMTLQVPKLIVEGRGVAKDIPHDIQWDEKKKSYIYSSGPAQGLRPFIKDGMILKGKTTPTVPQNNNDIPSKAESTVNIDTQISQIESLNVDEKQFCKELFGILTGQSLEAPALQLDMVTILWEQASAQINKLSSSTLGYQNITDGNFIVAMENFLRTILSDKSIPEKTKIALENKVKTSNKFSSIKIDSIIHETSAERYLTPEKIAIAEQKNKSFFESQPDLKKFVLDFLPKALGYEGEMSYKKLSLLIAQLQTIHHITPINGFVTDIETGQLLIQECSQAKIAITWKSGKMGGNNYLPTGIKFLAPLSQAEKDALKSKLPDGKNLDDGINDISYQCAAYLTYMNGGISGNAWTMPDFIINEGGQEIANTLRNTDWTKLPTTPSTEQIQTHIQAEIKAHPIDISQVKVGDVITMMHPKSKFQERAFQEGLATSTRMVSTHVGQVTEKNGQLFVTHNIHGTIYSEHLPLIISGKSVEGDIATGIFRLNSGDDVTSQLTREGARLGRKVKNSLDSTLAMIP